MDEKQVRERVGPADEIMGRSDRMRSRLWVCSSCGEVVITGEPITVPAPCKHCGGIAFKVPSSG
jgi:hypothetical protein